MDEQKYKQISQYLINNTYPKDTTEYNKEKIRKQSENYLIQDQKLFRKAIEGNPKRVILPEQTELVLFYLHKEQNGAHLGIKATYEKVKERYYWPKMYETIKQYIKTCDNCQRRGKPKRQERLIPLIVGQPFHRIGMDHFQ
jgi:hypothetical protein